MNYKSKLLYSVTILAVTLLGNQFAVAEGNTSPNSANVPIEQTPTTKDNQGSTAVETVPPVKTGPTVTTEPSTPVLPNPLDAIEQPMPSFMAYADFPKIQFNPSKPLKNPLAVYKLKNIAHTLPLIDALTRLHVQKLAKTNSVIKGLKIWKGERKMLSRKFILNNYKSIWFKDGLLDFMRANEIITTLNNAEAFGLRPDAYKGDDILQLIIDAAIEIKPEWKVIPGSKEKLKELQANEDLNQVALLHAKLELALTHAALAYTRHASAGQVIPYAVDRNNDVHPKPTSANLIMDNLRNLSKKGALQSWLEAQNPQSKQFKALLAEFKKHALGNQKPEDIIKIGGGKTLKLGHKSTRIVQLARRLEQLGYYKKSIDSPYPKIYNKTIIASVKAYQTSKGLLPDGKAGVRTIGALNYRKPDYLKTLLVNIERQRWLPKEMGEKHVLVNQAEYRLRIFENDEVTHTARVVIGKNKHQTPSFYNNIRTVVVNPYWNIPNSIIYNEMRRKIQNDPTYLRRNNYQVAGNMNWEKATPRYVPFSIRQKPGSGNALGRVKFLFPNRHSIYLHDTPSKSLFSRASRNFSHGCVRVQNPELLAQNLMGWSNKQFKSLVRSGKNRHFALKKKIPVYLTYMTASLSEDGEVHYFRDVYNRDNAVAKALGVKQILKKIADARSPILETAMNAR